MAERIRTCIRRERPNVAISLRLDYDKADQITDIAEQTGKPVAAILEELVLYALSKARLANVTRKALIFEEGNKDD